MSNNKQRERVLVTGGSGLVGRALFQVVHDDNSIRDRFEFFFLSSKDADLRNLVETESIFRKIEPTYVINLAARVGGLYANMENNDTFYDDNVKINDNVLHVSNEFKVKKCISCLSTCIFPAEVEYPLDESKIHLGPPHSSNIGYSLAKRGVDLLNRKLSLPNGVSLFTAVIPTNIYGPHDNFSPKQSHIIPGLIHKAHQCIMDRKSALIVCGSGSPLRQFIYSADLAKLLLLILENYKQVEPLILCPDESDEVSIEQIAHLITKVFDENLNYRLDVSFDTSFSDGQFRKTASNRKLKSLFPEFKFTPLELGVREVVSWYLKNYPNVRLGNSITQ